MVHTKPTVNTLTANTSFYHLFYPNQFYSPLIPINSPQILPLICITEETYGGQLFYQCAHFSSTGGSWSTWRNATLLQAEHLNSIYTAPEGRVDHAHWSCETAAPSAVPLWTSSPETKTENAWNVHQNLRKEKQTELKLTFQVKGWSGECFQQFFCFSFRYPYPQLIDFYLPDGVPSFEKCHRTFLCIWEVGCWTVQFISWKIIPWTA